MIEKRENGEEGRKRVKWHRKRQERGIKTLTVNGEAE